MIRDISLAGTGVVAGVDHPDKLHHIAILVSQNVTVKHVRAGEVHKSVANPDPAGCHLAIKFPVGGLVRTALNPTLLSGFGSANVAQEGHVRQGGGDSRLKLRQRGCSGFGGK
jgi:hypothetical protein